MNIGVIGLGYWGPNYVKAMHLNAKVKKIKLFDLSTANTQKAFEISNKCEIATTVDDAIKNMDGVIISTPASTHYEIAKKGIFHKVPMLIEKPLTNSIDKEIELFELSIMNNIPILVGYTFAFHPMFALIKSKLPELEKKYGEVVYCRSTRTNFGPVRNDVNALQDLAAHDVFIGSWLFGVPIKVNETTIHQRRYSQASTGRLELLHLRDKGNVSHSIYVSWDYPKKTRTFDIGFENGHLTYEPDSSIASLFNYHGYVLAEEEKLICDTSRKPLNMQLDEFLAMVSIGGHNQKSMDILSHSLNVTKTLF